MLITVPPLVICSPLMAAGVVSSMMAVPRMAEPIFTALANGTRPIFTAGDSASSPNSVSTSVFAASFSAVIFQPAIEPVLSSTMTTSSLFCLRSTRLFTVTWSVS